MKPTLRDLIKIAQLSIEDKTEAKIAELAILSNKTIEEFKKLSLDKIEALIKHFDYLYGDTPPAIGIFVLNEKTYTLPIDLGKLEYGQWEDIQVVLKNNQFGKTDWEKLRYLLYIMTSKDYVENKLSENIEEGSRVFLDIPAKEVLGLISFFQSKEKPYLISTGLSSLLTAKTEAS